MAGSEGGMITYENKKTKRQFKTVQEIATFDQFVAAFGHNYKDKHAQFMMQFDFKNLRRRDDSNQMNDYQNGVRI